MQMSVEVGKKYEVTSPEEKIALSWDGTNPCWWSEHMDEVLYEYRFHKSAEEFSGSSSFIGKILLARRE